jgi:AraC-like DNA-binding protein
VANENGYYFYPPYITLAHLFHAPAGWAIRDRVMNQYVLQYVVDGAAEYPVEPYHYVTRKGDLLFHRPGELHSIVTIPGERYVCISLVFHYGGEPFPFEQLFGGKHVLGNFVNQPVERMLTQLVALYKQPGLAEAMQCQGLLLNILAGAAGHIQETAAVETDHGMRNRAKMVLIKNYLLEHYAEPVEHKQLEQISGLSRNYIISEFKQAFGMSPMQYLIWIRINKAKELAIQTNYSVSEIAGRVGYADVHTFGKVFKKKTGVSLSRFCAALVLTR